ncbi:MAG: hypothetical protein ACP5XB_15120 [Isosphaeraceae bacterium]
MQTALLAVTLSLTAVGCHHRSVGVSYSSVCYGACYGGCYGQAYGGGYGQAYGVRRAGPFRRMMGGMYGSGYGSGYSMPMVQNAGYGSYGTPYVAGSGMPSTTSWTPGPTYGTSGYGGYTMPATTYTTPGTTPYTTPGMLYGAPGTTTTGMLGAGAAGTAGRTYSSAYGPATSGTTPTVPETNYNVPGAGQPVIPGSSGNLLPATPSAAPPAPSIPR